jgi:hypothetical protein
LPAVLRDIIDHPEKVKIGRPTDYTPEACYQVIALMQRGLSLTGAAGMMGITRATIHNWRKKYPDFLDSVELGKARRVATLETDRLETENATTANIRRLALINAAPNEWREKHNVEHETAPDDPIRMFAKQLMGTAIRPRLPEPTIIEHDAAEPRVIRPQQNVTNVTTNEVVTRVKVVTRATDDNDKPRTPRIHDFQDMALMPPMPSREERRPNQLAILHF